MTASADGGSKGRRKSGSLDALRCVTLRLSVPTKLNGQSSEMTGATIGYLLGLSCNHWPLSTKARFIGQPDEESSADVSLDHPFSIPVSCTSSGILYHEGSTFKDKLYQRGSPFRGSNGQTPCHLLYPWKNGPLRPSWFFVFFIALPITGFTSASSLQGSPSFRRVLSSIAR